MTEYEYIQSIFYNYELMKSWYMDFITVFFAYVVTGHLFGGSLSRSVAMAVTVIYSLFSFVTFITLIGSTLYATDLIGGMNSSYPDAVLRTEPATFLGLTLTLGPLLIAWLARIIYLHAVVRKNGNA
jgi:hypothetical protein